MLKDFKKFVVNDVILGGNLIIKDGRYVHDFSLRFKYPTKAYRTINIKRLRSPAELLTKVNVHNGIAEVITIRVTPGKTITKKDKALVKVRDKYLSIREDQDITYVSVIERHHASGSIGRGFVTGLGLRAGAVAQSIAHDTHNIVVVGKNPVDMYVAVNGLSRIGGGIVGVVNGKVIGEVALPIAGLMSDKKFEDLTQDINKIAYALKMLNLSYHAAFMTIALLTLPVIPEIRITARGLVDALEGKLIEPILSLRKL